MIAVVNTKLNFHIIQEYSFWALKSISSDINKSQVQNKLRFNRHRLGDNDFNCSLTTISVPTLQKLTC